MKITILGAGAIGGNIAAHLARGGLDVSVVARGAHLAAIQANGLRFTSPSVDFTVRLRATDRPEDLGPQDLVIATAKAHSLPAAVPGLKALLGPDTPVIYGINGVPWWYFHGHPKPAWAEKRIERLDPDGGLWDGIGIDRTIGCVLTSPMTVTAPGVVHCNWDKSSFMLGEPKGGLTPRLTGLVAALKPGLEGVNATADIRTAVWSKIILNLAGSSIGVLSASTAGDIPARPELKDLYRKILEEGAAVAAGLGVSVSADFDGRMAAMMGTTHRASMLQDLESGRPLELDAQFDAVRDLARLAGVPTPVLDILVPLLRMRARQ